MSQPKIFEETWSVLSVLCLMHILISCITELSVNYLSSSKAKCDAFIFRVRILFLSEQIQLCSWGQDMVESSTNLPDLLRPKSSSATGRCKLCFSLVEMWKTFLTASGWRCPQRSEANEVYWNWGSGRQGANEVIFNSDCSKLKVKKSRSRSSKETGQSGLARKPASAATLDKCPGDRGGTALAPHLCLLTCLVTCFFPLRLWTPGSWASSVHILMWAMSCLCKQELRKPIENWRPPSLAFTPDSVCPSNSASGSSVSNLRKQVGSCRDCRTLCFRPDRKSAHHLDLTKRHCQRGAGRLPLQFGHGSLLFLWLRHENTQSYLKRWSNNMHNTGMPWEDALVQRWFPWMVPEYSMQQSWHRHSSLTLLCVIHRHIKSCTRDALELDSTSTEKE